MISQKDRLSQEFVCVDYLEFVTDLRKSYLNLSFKLKNSRVEKQDPKNQKKYL